MDYNFIEANKKFGVEWFSEEGNLIGTDWYNTEEERNEAIDGWYSEQDEFNLEQ